MDGANPIKALVDVEEMYSGYSVRGEERPIRRRNCLNHARHDLAALRDVNDGQIGRGPEGRAKGGIEDL